ncbi:MAG: MFS transporter [Planctomycetota bacterium]|nr:MAG: MFS transporter [Planctomycetota bacterium]
MSEPVPSGPLENGSDRPPVLRDRSFWGMIITQFLGAFNDNLYKQMMLLMAIPAAGMAAGAQTDLQGWATLVFSLPFVLFSGYAGYLSDRYSKTPIIVACKVAEIVIMLLGLAAFYYYDLFGMTGTWVVLFLMATQSAFFGPGKYGILPELFRPQDLPRANGLMLMTTFLAIIFGVVAAGGLKKALAGGEAGRPQDLAVAMLVCVGIAVAGTLSSLMIRRVPPAQPGAKLTIDALAISRDVWHLLQRDRTLLGALLVSSLFWMVSGMAAPTVNRLGLDMLGQTEFGASFLSAFIAFGIMVGAVLAGVLCRRGWSDRCVTIGLSGICGCLFLLGIWMGGNQHLLGFYGSIVGLFALGVFAAVFAIPIQVFLQARPPSTLKGRMIATMNQANFIGILISGPLYQLFEAISRWLEWPICSVFWMMMLLVAPVAACYRLRSAAQPAAGPADTTPQDGVH